jgi:hypothetical protein
MPSTNSPDNNKKAKVEENSATTKEKGFTT